MCTVIKHDKQEFYENTDMCCCMFRDTGLPAVLLQNKIQIRY